MQVTLVIPWLAKMDQQMVFPNGITFDSPEGQEAYVRNWVKQRTGMDCKFDVRFYPGRYATEKYSILPVGDPTAYINDAEVGHPQCLPSDMGSVTESQVSSGDLRMQVVSSGILCIPHPLRPI